MFPFSQLFDLGLGVGVGLAAVVAPLTLLFMVWDKYAERRDRRQRASRRRPPSISGNTEELPAVRRHTTFKWGKDV